MSKLTKEASSFTDRIEKLLQRDSSRVPADVREQAQKTIVEIRESIRQKDEKPLRRHLDELRQVQKEYFPGSGRRRSRTILEFVVLAVLVSLFMRSFVIAAFTIPTSSMAPTLTPGDVILVWKSAYGVNVPFTGWRLLKIRKPRRWEVMVFSTKDIPVEKRDRGKPFIKRVVGLPGEKIEIKNGEVYANGRLTARPKELRTIKYVRKGFPAFNNAPKIKVPPGKYFVLGDNTRDSEDSRFWGFVPEKSIRGRAFVVFFPLNRAGSI